SHLSEDERGQIGVLRTAGWSMGAIARALGRAKATISRELQRNASPRAGTRRFTPPEPINCAGGVKRSSNERPLYVCSYSKMKIVKRWLLENSPLPIEHTIRRLADRYDRLHVCFEAGPRGYGLYRPDPGLSCMVVAPVLDGFRMAAR